MSNSLRGFLSFRSGSSHHKVLELLCALLDRIRLYPKCIADACGRTSRIPFAAKKVYVPRSKQKNIKWNPPPNVYGTWRQSRLAPGRRILSETLWTPTWGGRYIRWLNGGASNIGRQRSLNDVLGSSDELARKRIQICKVSWATACTGEACFAQT